MIWRDFLLIAASAIFLAHGPVGAQKHSASPILIEAWSNCPPDIDRYGDWISNRPPLEGERNAVPNDAVHEVVQSQRERAVALLNDAEIVALTFTHAEELAGEMPTQSAQYGKPFLIRNVVPSFIGGLRGPVRLDRVGSALTIRAGLFGCGGFFKNPLVVFLSSAPTRVDMQVSAIW
ncbi:hypothetical protein [Sphingobium aromaticiconvertens]|uniref:hypothetical protein n=1 Tax=Sphingobium aromaticiconvertens TaxID=365341 RepID=UPI00301704F5